jgi:hypothetical protein
MYRITGDSFTVFGDAVGDDAGNFEVAHADVPAAGMDHSVQMVKIVMLMIIMLCSLPLVCFRHGYSVLMFAPQGWFQLRQRALQF